jgi:hypothetical protein
MLNPRTLPHQALTKWQAGMVPRIQFALADQKHYDLYGNIV